VRKQKTNQRDEAHLLELLLTEHFPRIWVPSPEERDVCQLLRHRHRLVGMRTAVRNQLHALAMSQGVCRRKKLWIGTGRQELEGLKLLPWFARRREELLKLLGEPDTSIHALDQAVEREARARINCLVSNYYIWVLQRHPQSTDVLIRLAFRRKLIQRRFVRKLHYGKRLPGIARRFRSPSN